jgi:c-di-GMP-binding flagellar brake protein YcgR
MTELAASVKPPCSGITLEALPPENDRRVARRFRCEGTAEVIVLGGALRFAGEVQNLSATGCCLRTNVSFSLERGTHVEIVMAVNNIQFRVAGGVRSNSKVRGVGMEFMNVSARCARYIKDLIAELEAKQKEESQ